MTVSIQRSMFENDLKIPVEADRLIKINIPYRYIENPSFQIPLISIRYMIDT